MLQNNGNFALSSQKRDLNSDNKIDVSMLEKIKNYEKT